MSLSLFACGLLSTLLPVSWQGVNGWTYTVQHSLDMLHWEAFPYVFTGTGSWESLLLEIDGSPVFARWRFSATGDTNGNGLPDNWEWSAFGMLDIDPSADPDLDGANNLSEWANGTDPTDFFNGETVVVTLTCGNEWLVSPGESSTQEVSLIVTDASGRACPGAPVILRLPDGHGTLQSGNDSPRTELVVYTDTLGRVHPSVTPVKYVAPNSGSQSEFLEISAGHVIQSLLIRTTGSNMGLPPREFACSVQADGTGIFQWNGDPGEASAFVIEEQSESGEWIPITELAIAELPTPDPDTGRYTLTVESPAMP